MPLETTVQNFDIILRNEDFGANILLGQYTDQVVADAYKDYVKIGKWVQIVPTQLLSSTRKLFIDVTNKLYSIENINQAIRLFVRPLIFYNLYRGSSLHLMCNENTADGDYPFGDEFRSYALGSPTATIRTTGKNSDDINTYIFKTDLVKEVLRTALGELPEESKTTTFYLDGKFLANQPHIEHLNSGDYSLYNNIRAITLPAGTAAGTKLNEVNLENVTNGFILNTYLANPVGNYETKDISFDYALFNLKLKFINDIVDLPTSYLSYWPMYKRFIGIFKSGNPATKGDIHYNTYSVLTQNTYSAFEFFLAPVGEAS